MRKAVVVVVASILNSAAWAQFMQAEGEFVSPTVSAQIILLDSEKGIAAAKTEIVSGGCSGSVSGIGQITGRNLTFSSYVKEQGGENCLINIAFDSSWKRIKITGRNCSHYSGAACGWEGQSASKRPAK